MVYNGGGYGYVQRMGDFMKHLFIVNPESFRYKRGEMDEVIAGIHDFFREFAPDDYDIRISRFPRDAVGYIISLGKALPEDITLRVYAVGGDGILFDCLNGLINCRNMELAAIPYGRINDFVRGFGKKSIKLFRDISLQAVSPGIPIDVIRCGNNYALNFCSIGVEGKTARNAFHIREWLEKNGPLTTWLCDQEYEIIYYVGAILSFFNKQILRQRYKMDIDGESITGNFRAISIFNGTFYGGGCSPLPKAMPNDGKLDVLLTPGGGILKSLLEFPFFISGRHSKLPGCRYIQARRVKIHSDIPMHIDLDNAVFFENDFSLELMPGAVKFIDVTGQGYLGRGGG
jgi:diacylglycerol kinase family enzyme